MSTRRTRAREGTSPTTRNTRPRRSTSTSTPAASAAAASAAATTPFETLLQMPELVQQVFYPLLSPEEMLCCSGVSKRSQQAVHVLLSNGMQLGAMRMSKPRLLLLLQSSHRRFVTDLTVMLPPPPPLHWMQDSEAERLLEEDKQLYQRHNKELKQDTSALSCALLSRIAKNMPQLRHLRCKLEASSSKRYTFPPGLHSLHLALINIAQQPKCARPDVPIAIESYHPFKSSFHYTFLSSKILQARLDACWRLCCSKV